MSLEIDELSTAELNALDSIERFSHLNDLCREIKRLGDEKERALEVLGDAKIALCDDPKNAEFKKTKIRAERLVQKIANAVSTRKEQVKIIQTIINSETRLSR